ncbi:MAG: hypothetical protein AAGE59_32105 [Cyanobacteria bacterium P01_F01_bin.86]
MQATTNTLTPISIELDLWHDDDAESTTPDATHEGALQVTAGLEDHAIGQLVNKYAADYAKAHGYSTENFNSEWDYTLSV